MAIVGAAAVAGCGKSRSGEAGSRPVEKPAAGEPAPAADPTPALAQRPRMVRPDPLPTLARDVLNESMLRHGDDMESLLWASLTLDYETTSYLAGSMLAAPRISRPPGDAEVLNAVFPPRFFDHQDALYGSLEALQDAAKRRSDTDIAASYGRLAQTCISCHALYLRPGSAKAAAPSP